jgi:hypothetical protein
MLMHTACHLGCKPGSSIDQHPEQWAMISSPGVLCVQSIAVAILLRTYTVVHERRATGRDLRNSLAVIFCALGKKSYNIATTTLIQGWLVLLK